MTRHRRAERRTYFRLSYPPADRPILLLYDEEYEITELSENTFTFRKKGELGLGNEPWMLASIRFHDGEEVRIEGVVIREEEAKAVVRVRGGISFQRMMKEQRHLVAKYRS